MCYIFLTIFVVDNVPVGSFLDIFWELPPNSVLLLPAANTCAFALTNCSGAIRATLSPHTEPPYREFTSQGWHLTCAGEEGESESPAPRSRCIWTSCQSSTERPGRRHPFQNVPYMAPFPVLPPPSQALAFSRDTSLINLLTQILGMGPDSEELDLRQYEPPSLQKEKCSPLYTQNYLSILS